MILYVVGPVTGRENLNRAAFDEAARALRGAGHFPSIPHRNVPPDAEWPDAMRRSIRAMLRCNGVARLPDWRSSRGGEDRVEAGARPRDACEGRGGMVPWIARRKMR